MENCYCGFYSVWRAQLAGAGRQCSLNLVNFMHCIAHKKQNVGACSFIRTQLFVSREPNDQCLAAASHQHPASCPSCHVSRVLRILAGAAQVRAEELLVFSCHGVHVLRGAASPFLTCIALQPALGGLHRELHRELQAPFRKRGKRGCYVHCRCALLVWWSEAVVPFVIHVSTCS